MQTIEKLADGKYIAKTTLEGWGIVYEDENGIWNANILDPRPWDPDDEDRADEFYCPAVDEFLASKGHPIVSDASPWIYQPGEIVNVVPIVEPYKN